MSLEKPHRLHVLAPDHAGAQPIAPDWAGPDRTVRAAIERGLSGGSVEGESSEGLMQVGELAKATGKTVRAIHLYEELGLLTPKDRSKGRYRLFTRDALVRVRWIGKLQSLGLSLSQIQDVVARLEDASTARAAAARLQEVYAQKLAETRAKLCELQELERELSNSLKFLAICDSACEAELPSNSCPTCDRHPEQNRPPELVVGAHNST